MKRKLVSTYLGRCGDIWVRDYVEIGFLPCGETGRKECPCSRMLQPAWHDGLQQIRFVAPRKQILTFYSSNFGLKRENELFSFPAHCYPHLQCFQYTILFADVLYQDKFKIKLIP
jgi:hypothetical protein